MAYIQNIENPTSRTNSMVVAIFPFKHKHLPGGKYDPSKALELDKRLFIEKKITSLAISSAKGSPTSRTNIVLKDTDNEVVEKVAPGDWMMIWLCNNIEKAEEIRQLVDREKAANAADSGLKFVGRVTSVNRAGQLNPTNGVITKTVSIQGTGFYEFETQIYFDPALDLTAGKSQGFWFLARLQGALSTTVRSVISTVKSMQSLLINTFLGNGPGGETAGLANSKFANNRCFMIPTRIAKTLGSLEKDPDAKLFTYSALLSVIMGTQQYDGSSNIPSNITGSGLQREAGRLSGGFPPMTSPWSGVPIWSAMQQYLNGAVNEMYTCLRIAPDGIIRPTLIIRQIPFTSDEFAKSSTALTTPFLSLPTWNIPQSYLLQMNVTKSDGLRSNFWQITNIAPPDTTGKMELALQRAINPAVSDVNEVIRHGLRPIIRHTNTFDRATANNKAPIFWRDLTQDHASGLHLKWSGAVVLHGIQECICEGDNVEIEDITYHIEEVSHNVSVTQPNGAIVWTTTIKMSNGVPTKGGLPSGAEIADNIVTSDFYE